MAEYLSPGVYVEEFDSGGVPMAGVSTSTAGFLGLAEKGSVEGIPELITGPADFRRIFGSYLSENAFGEYRYLAYAVDHFFANGGSRCYVMRVAPSDAKVSTNITKEDKSPVLQFSAKNPGEWGDKIRVTIGAASKAKTQIYEVLGAKLYKVKSCAGFNQGDVVVFNDGARKQYNRVISSQDNVIELETALEGDVKDNALMPVKVLMTCEFNVQVSFGDEAESFEKVSLNAGAANYVVKVLEKSNIVKVAPVANMKDKDKDKEKDKDKDKEKEKVTEGLTPFQMISGLKDEEGSVLITLSGGSDGSLAKLAASDFIGEDRGPGKRTGLQSFIDNDEVAIMAVPGVTDPNVQLSLVAHCENLKSRIAVLDVPRENKKVADVMAHRNLFDSSYCAMYAPWLQVFDPLDKKNIFIPPSGSVAGVYSRSDQTRGVHKAPANEVVRSCIGLDCQYNKGEQDILNPLGVNLIRYFTGQGIRVWGARTCSSNGLWKYVNVRRLFIFLEESIKRGTNWVVFEPNDEPLWARVQRTIDAFLTRVWRDGALMGSSPAEAFYINIGRNTMTQDDIDNGRLICVIGVAPVKPAEFVIFRITQKTSEQ
ncbi:MAG: phage tail sheath family protein [Syntrophomonas sp.]